MALHEALSLTFAGGDMDLVISEHKAAALHDRILAPYVCSI